jgi:tetratricopeptide (TPR) repeat protein
MRRRAALYPQVIVKDGVPQPEPPLSRAFHQSDTTTHFIGRRTSTAIWGEDSVCDEALKAFEGGQTALYTHKQPVEAIVAYEKSIAADPGFLKPYVGLALACLQHNSASSLLRAETLYQRLLEFADTDWLSPIAVSILHQNLGSLFLHRALGKGPESEPNPAELLAQATDAFTRADAVALSTPEGTDGRLRLTLLAPYALALLRAGRFEVAKNIWSRARAVESALLDGGRTLTHYVERDPDLLTLETLL